MLKFLIVVLVPFDVGFVFRVCTSHDFGVRGVLGLRSKGCKQGLVGSSFGDLQG